MAFEVSAQRDSLETTVPVCRRDLVHGDSIFPNDDGDSSTRSLSSGFNTIVETISSHMSVSVNTMVTPDQSKPSRLLCRTRISQR